jgi:hypothetical protein
MSNYEAQTIEKSHAAALALGPMIAKRAGEIEAGRRIPGDLLEDLICRAGISQKAGARILSSAGRPQWGVHPIEGLRAGVHDRSMSSLF